MNIRNILLSVAAGALACSCNFSEDDCIRLGHLRAYCNFAEIEAKDIPVPTSRHLIAYGISEDFGATGKKDFYPGQFEMGFAPW